MKGQSQIAAKTHPPRRRWKILLALVAAATALSVWLLWPGNNVPEHRVTATPAPGAHRTLAEIWRWPATSQAGAKTKTEKHPAEEHPIGRIYPSAVVRALGRVEFDENGKAIIDHHARTILEDSFKSLPDLTPEELDAVQKIIRAGVPGPEGARVAKIVADYYRYRSALQVYEGATNAPTTSDGARTQLNYLASMRDKYLGPVVARRFYAEDEALQRYLIDSKGATGADAAALQRDLQNGVMYLGSRTSPQAEALNQEMQSLRAQGASEDYLRYVQQQQLGLYTANTLARTPTEQRDWQLRYTQFLRDRQAILDAGLTEEDKKKQIETLLAQSFTSEELEAIRAYEPP